MNIMNESYNTGRIYQISSKPKIEGERGLPKFARDFAYVTSNGVEGDFNHFRKSWKFNTSLRALLIYPKEMYDKLQTEGWSVFPGDLGENITTGGIFYENFGINSIWRVGEIKIQISEVCSPCKNLRFIPSIGMKVKEFVQTLVGRRGWYAKVLEEGTIKKGDLVERVS